MPNPFITTLLSLYVHIRHRNIERNLRYFCRDTYYCELRQLKYFFKDYVVKEKYKEVAYAGEFAAELTFAIPHAYWHFKNGTLKSTKGARFSKELYFFSPHHEEVFEERELEGNYNYDVPRVLYSHNYNMSKWERVPYKETFQNDVFVFDKPPLVIANRYNSEWGGPPISFLDIPTLDELITQLKDQYTILYNRPRPQHISIDNSFIYDLNEYDWLKEKHPEVILMEDLFHQNRDKVNNYNHLQLLVYANCDTFISTHGGTSVLASLFGGINIILSKKGPEHVFGCYQKLYPKLSDTKVLHAKDYDELRSYVGQYLKTN